MSHCVPRDASPLRCISSHASFAAMLHSSRYPSRPAVEADSGPHSCQAMIKDWLTGSAKSGVGKARKNLLQAQLERHVKAFQGLGGTRHGAVAAAKASHGRPPVAPPNPAANRSSLPGIHATQSKPCTEQKGKKKGFANVREKGWWFCTSKIAVVV